MRPIHTITKSIAFLLVSLVLLGCESQGNVLTGARVTQDVKPVQYSGPKRKVAVGPVKNRTGVQTEVERTGTTIQTGAAAADAEKKETVRDPIGSGMRDQLITSLTQTGAFTVTRTQEQAEFVLEGAVTEYEPSQASIAGGFGWNSARARRPVRASDPTVSAGNIFTQVLRDNAFGGFGEQDHIAMSVHLYNHATQEIVASTTVEAKPKDLGVAMNTLASGPGAFMVDTGAQMKTPMQKAIRACMAKAAVWAARKVQSIPPTKQTVDVPPTMQATELAEPEDKTKQSEQRSLQQATTAEHQKPGSDYESGGAMLEIFKADSFINLPELPVIRTMWKSDLANSGGFLVPERISDVGEGSSYVGKFSFYFEAKQTGQYGFILSSGSSSTRGVRRGVSKLVVGDVEIINNQKDKDFVHQGICSLKKGFHRIEFYFMSQAQESRDNATFSMKVLTPGGFDSVPVTKNMMLLKKAAG